MLVDAKIISCSQAIRTYHFASSSSEKGTTVLSLNNVVFSHCDYFIYFPDDTYLTQDVSAWTIGYLQLGDEADQGTVNNGFFALNVTRPAVLTDAKDSGTYFRRPWVLQFAFEFIHLAMLMRVSQKAILWKLYHIYGL